jgi:hypothetical protein
MPKGEAEDIFWPRSLRVPIANLTTHKGEAEDLFWPRSSRVPIQSPILQQTKGKLTSYSNPLGSLFSHQSYNTQREMLDTYCYQHPDLIYKIGYSKQDCVLFQYRVLCTNQFKSILYAICFHAVGVFLFLFCFLICFRIKYFSIECKCLLTYICLFTCLLTWLFTYL